MLTDYVLALLCLWFAVSLPSTVRQARRWKMAFVVTALAAVLGGTAHGFRVPLGDSVIVVWILTVAGIVASAAFLITLGVRSAFQPEAGPDPARGDRLGWLRRAVAITLVAFALLVLGVSVHQHFNQNDLYHVIQMAGLYSLYRAAWLEPEVGVGGRRAATVP